VIILFGVIFYVIQVEFLLKEIDDLRRELDMKTYVKG